MQKMSEFNGKKIGTNYIFEKEEEGQLITDYLNNTREIENQDDENEALIEQK